MKSQAKRCGMRSRAMPWRLRAGGLGVMVWLAVGVAPAGADGNIDQNGAVLPAPAPSAKSMSIRVISAYYGHSSSAGSCVVTQSLEGICNGRSRCIVTVGDQLCRPPNTLPTELILTLTVQYKCTPIVAARTAKADKPFQLVIDCGATAH